MFRSNVHQRPSIPQSYIAHAPDFNVPHLSVSCGRILKTDVGRTTTHDSTMLPSLWEQDGDEGRLKMQQTSHIDWTFELEGARE